jgi:4-hydroxy-3-polyprenylbenzoate decarboxylase
LIVGITGASGVAYGIRLLEVLQPTDIETHLVVSPTGKQTIKEETDVDLDHVRSLADVVHASGDMGASISSGSFQTLGMVVAPCSVRSLSEIAFGGASTLLTRAADVVLKERRRLVLLVRETPLRGQHLRAMVAAHEDGAILMPPVPAYYTRPQTIDDIMDHTVGRVLDQFGLDHDLVHRWEGSRERPDR